MDTLFFIVIGLCLVFTSGEPEDNRLVNLGSKTKLEQSILDYNQTTLDDVVLNKSVGNHGRYKNIGYDYEFLRREPRMISDKERKKGLRWYTKGGYNFIYMKSEKTTKFIYFIERDKHG